MAVLMPEERQVNLCAYLGARTKAVAASFFISMFVTARADLFGVSSLEAEVAKVTTLDGVDFAARRTDLERKFREASTAFREVQGTTTSWTVRIVCAIVAERVEKAPAVRRLLEQREPRAYNRSTTERIAARGGWLVKQARDTPMILVESLWKGNELQVWPDSLETEAYIAYALGVLKVANAREVLEEVLRDDFFERRKADARISQKAAHRWQIREEAARALGVLGDSRSVPALVEFLMIALESHNNASLTAAESLRKCADRSSASFLQSVLKETKSETMRNTLIGVVGVKSMDGEQPAVRTVELLAGLPSKVRKTWEEACIQESAGQYDKMVIAVDEFVEAMPTNVSPAMMCAVAAKYLRAGSMDKAEEILCRYLERCEDDWKVWCDLAAIQIKLGRSDAARASIHAALRIGRDAARVYVERDGRLKTLLGTK